MSKQEFRAQLAYIVLISIVCGMLVGALSINGFNLLFIALLFVNSVLILDTASKIVHTIEEEKE